MATSHTRTTRVKGEVHTIEQDAVSGFCYWLGSDGRGIRSAHPITEPGRWPTTDLDEAERILRESLGA